MLLAGLGVVFTLAVLSWAILWHNSPLLYKTLVHGERKGNCVAITFDDGPHPAFTTRALDVLASHGAKATFFCLGCLVESHPEVLRRVHADGHLVGSHGLDHSISDFFRPPASAYRCMIRTGSLIRQITGYFPRFYRPPVGIKTPPRVLAAHRLGLALAGWSRQAMDGGAQPLSMDRALRLVSGVQPGDILLLHDGRISASGKVLNSNDLAVEEFSRALDALVGGLQKRGLQIVRLDLLAGLPPGIALPQGVAPG